MRLKSIMPEDKMNTFLDDPIKIQEKIRLAWIIWQSLKWQWQASRHYSRTSLDHAVSGKRGNPTYTIWNGHLGEKGCKEDKIGMVNRQKS